MPLVPGACRLRLTFASLISSAEGWGLAFLLFECSTPSKIPAGRFCCTLLWLMYSDKSAGGGISSAFGGVSVAIFSLGICVFAVSGAVCLTGGGVGVSCGRIRGGGGKLGTGSIFACCITSSNGWSIPFRGGGGDSWGCASSGSSINCASIASGIEMPISSSGFDRK